MRALSVWVGSLGIVLISCGGSDATSSSSSSSAVERSSASGSEATGSTVVEVLPLAEQPGAEQDGPVAVDLAPSQLTNDTVARPVTPEPCAVADLEFWTAQVQIGSSSADAVIRVRNAGTVWCEADISLSPLIDPDVEPDVWLDPGAWADLVVGQSGDECAEPATVTRAQIEVNGDRIVVPTAAIATCGWRLTAFFPNDLAVDACTPDQLEFAVRDRVLLVHNFATAACTLGDVVPTGISEAALDSAVTEPSIVDLARGDVVAFDLIDDESCGEPVVEFASAGSFPVGTPACTSVRSAAGRPYFGTDIGPLAASGTDSIDVEALLLLMDPFAADQ